MTGRPGDRAPFGGGMKNLLTFSQATKALRDSGVPRTRLVPVIDRSRGGSRPRRAWSSEAPGYTYEKPRRHAATYKVTFYFHGDPGKYLAIARGVLSPIDEDLSGSHYLTVELKA